MCTETKKQVDLGFVEECESVFLRNVYFPSKIGGKPAWLDLDIPSADELKCPKCEAPKSFLCQIYAPIEDNPECFHRTIFLFICREPSCFLLNSPENISAFRSQLPRQNTFYPAVPPNEDEELDSIEPSFKLCAACGCRGALMCSRCKSTNYCCSKHQRAHWPQHKLVCQSEKKGEETTSVPLVTFPEFEIVIEQESANIKVSDEEDEAADKRRLDDFQKLVEEGKAGSMNDVPEAELTKYTAEDQNSDVSFHKFKKRISANPSQVLRYDLGGEPLWIADLQKTLGDVKVPSCPNCGSDRQFEFQIMPQMVNYLKDDNVDWGVLAVYTCKNSCKGATTYQKECIVKQDLISDDNK